MGNIDPQAGLPPNLLQASRLCRIFAQPGHSRRKRRPHPSITLVGNGPLNEARDRPAIAAADYIIRFNWMHQRLPFERVHLWVLKHHPGSPERWGGFDDLDAEELEEVLAQAPTLLFLGGPAEDVGFVLDRHSASIPPDTRVLHAPTDQYMAVFTAAFSRVKHTAESRLPTSGFTLAMLAAACTPPGTRVDVFGFNWSPRLASHHAKWSEHATMKAMAERGWMDLHFSPCDALRSCGRADHNWCRAGNTTCGYPEVVQLDMLSVVGQRPDVRRIVRLMYRRRPLPVIPGGGGSGSGRAGGKGAAAVAGGQHQSKAEAEQHARNAAAAAVEEWRLAALRPKRAGSKWGASHAAAAAGVTQVPNTPVCRALAGGTGSAAVTVALVGNGPLTSEQRRMIGASDRVVRMNMLNNWLPRERLDVWLARHAGRPPAAFYGFDQEGAGVTEKEVDAPFAAASAVLLWGGNASSVNALLKTYPAVDDRKVVHVPADSFLAHYDRLYRAAVPAARNVTTRLAVSPTTGFVATLMAMACLPAGARLNLFGFNWSPEHWARHDAAAERRAIEGFQAAGLLRVHPTPCAGLRACVKRLDVNCKATRPSCWVAPTVYLRDAISAVTAAIARRPVGGASAADAGNQARARAARHQSVAGSPDDDDLPHLCRRLHLSNVTRVALLGSGTLTAPERRAVRIADTTVRFDGLDRRLVGMQSMVWVSSFRKHTRAHAAGYEGLDFNIPPEPAAAFAAASSLVFWGGLHHNIKEALDRHSLTLQSNPPVARVVMDGIPEPLEALQKLVAPKKPGDVHLLPARTASAPFGVVLAALACSDNPRVQLLGFKSAVLDASFTKSEQAMIVKMVQRGFVQIFDTESTSP